MKKTLTAIFLTAVLLLLLVIPASAATGSLGTSAKLSDDGTSFTVDLIVKDNPGIIALTSKLTYDSKVFKLTAVKNGEIFDNIFMSSQNFSVNPYQNIWMEATAEEDIKTNGVLVSYTFEILKNAPAGESEFKFEISDVVNHAKDSTTLFKGCSFKVNVGANAAAQNITEEETIEIQPPVTTSQTEITSSETESSFELTSSDSETVDDETEKQNNDRTIVTVLTIVAVLVLGIGITLTALYFRKKSATKNNNAETETNNEE